MPEDTIHLALFNAIDPAAEAIGKLHELGIQDKDMSIISSVPYSDRMLGRPMTWTVVPRIAIGGFVVGLIISLLLNFGTPLLYPIRVGVMPYLPIPPTLVLTFEISMLGLMFATFLGVIWESAFPSFGPKEYHGEISNGRIAIVFSCPYAIHSQVHDLLVAMGAEYVHRTEATEL